MKFESQVNKTPLDMLFSRLPAYTGPDLTATGLMAYVQRETEFPSRQVKGLIDENLPI